MHLSVYIINQCIHPSIYLYILLHSHPCNCPNIQSIIFHLFILPTYALVHSSIYQFVHNVYSFLCSSIHPALHPSNYPIYTAIALLPKLPSHLFIYLFIQLSIHLSILSCFWLYIHPSIALVVNLSNLSIKPFDHPLMQLVKPSIHPFFYKTQFLSIYLSPLNEWTGIHSFILISTFFHSHIHPLLCPSVQ